MRRRPCLPLSLRPPARCAPARPTARPPAGDVSANVLKIHSTLVNHGRLSLGVDSQCVANLVYALTKLELTAKEDSLVSDICTNLVPVVQLILGQCSAQVRGPRRAPAGCACLPPACCLCAPSPGALRRAPPGRPCRHPAQGVGHLIWGYCKLARPPLDHLDFMLSHAADMLRQNMRGHQIRMSAQSKGVDAQVRRLGARPWLLRACLDGRARRAPPIQPRPVCWPPAPAQGVSNCVYGVGHMRSRGALREADVGRKGVASILDAAAAWVSCVLTRRLVRQLDGPMEATRVYAYLSRAEDVFSCQVGRQGRQRRGGDWLCAGCRRRPGWAGPCAQLSSPACCAAVPHQHRLGVRHAAGRRAAPAPRALRHVLPHQGPHHLQASRGRRRLQLVLVLDDPALPAGLH
jgi:hypothetical protein